MKTSSLSPVGERVEFLDIVRGFALLGIFLVNIQLFSSPKFYTEGTNIELWEHPIDQWVEAAIALFADGKFYTMFSILFGIGFFMFLSKGGVIDSNRLPLFKRRLLGLLMIGFIHLVFIWSGDILFNYALSGFLLLLFFRASKRTLLRWGVVFYFGAIALMSVFMMLAEVVNVYFPEQSDVVKTLFLEAEQVYQTGSYTEILMFRVFEELPFVAANYLLAVPMVLGLFMIGFYAAKQGLISPDEAGRQQLKSIWSAALIVGVITAALEQLLQGEQSLIHPVFDAGLKEFSGGIAGLSLCLFYMTSTYFLLNMKGRSLLRPLRHVGQMALTNYMMQSIIATSIFYGYGFGWFGHTHLITAVGLVCVIFLGQIVFSKVWLLYFNFGPLEWLWRFFTYKKRPVFRRCKSSSG
ncbi:uncharacterized protein B0H94_101253 [Salsuginibacillus halophilus]|uniref:DUF418 domain-containing protein n=1 Tax=Salsuginibacillus halophilus TaxID=517424 RepID=A0A2P8HYP5_9BACI|nr:DUF418 domain-containing protein [Salsuginibacillus halophilus]PSL51339.1 uncharacterized protein B0H94_101253 [Salsuginibacillus halophilus]